MILNPNRGKILSEIAKERSLSYMLEFIKVSPLSTREWSEFWKYINY